MEPENITMLNNLNPLSNNYTLRLKIICLWRKMMHDRPTETFRICMDEEGQKIQASCMHRILPRLQNHFKLDECLLISRPSLAPKYNFSFVKFKDVYQNRIEVNTTVDFIGYVEVCFNLEDTNKKDGTKGKRLNVKLKDLE